MMTLRQIRHFIAVAETGSISAAARRDLLPVYSFNAQGIYLAKAPTQKLRHPVPMLARWDELSARLSSDNSQQPLL